IPLTLAIVSALIVQVAGEWFAFPQLSVTEIVRIGAIHRAQRIKSAAVLRLRHKLLPLLHFKETLQLGIGDDERGFVVVMQTGSQSFGLVVDNVLHTEEIVIKPISSKLRHLGIFSGVTSRSSERTKNERCAACLGVLASRLLDGSGDQ